MFPYSEALGVDISARQKEWSVGMIAPCTRNFSSSLNFDILILLLRNENYGYGG